ncbi:hypothetical protein MJO28_006962 [Puccinia striiformis f. sp. tritici]|uniref:Uncharacterized protein n=4 Tax=Puccinia striiformis TaxID=27350 RepID=A0A0L0VGW1_9BASI|nr:hypothetical protein MJO28_006962 [Puccinia striiformis f. sp. tritici]KAI9621955.1 hypothetical protein H4Q26_015392 [Puccinia striiformis f. sp. tritici PST-130]KNE98510.1 hypothetical protein PSTG_08250 [Puccinia striiformis f. sp. tritici PST-78]POW13833.1 hypothetical protein PSTT_03488 [Puccinia striiformis]
MDGWSSSKGISQALCKRESRGRVFSFKWTHQLKGQWAIIETPKFTWSIASCARSRNESTTSRFVPREVYGLFAVSQSHNKASRRGSPGAIESCTSEASRPGTSIPARTQHGQCPRPWGLCPVRKSGLVCGDGT